MNHLVITGEVVMKNWRILFLCKYEIMRQWKYMEVYMLITLKYAKKGMFFFYKFSKWSISNSSIANTMIFKDPVFVIGSIQPVIRFYFYPLKLLQSDIFNHNT